jgi:F0F1-type ATP synthase membrane subunit b/b'
MLDPSLSGSDMLSNQIYDFFIVIIFFKKFVKNYINNINNNEYNNIKHA